MKKLSKSSPSKRDESVIFQVIQDGDGIHILIKGEKGDLARILAHAAKNSAGIFDIILQAQVLIALWETYKPRKPVPIDDQRD